ncbi:MAG: metallophosphoesterase [Candidatus Cloacimonas sp.]|jgi:3',5'-cyclic AMP phosphodiesterase CpdA|nr:metallophosphoesterase [Candidatus Cloacimonas sp.]
MYRYIALLIILICSVTLFSLSCYDIQYTTDASGDSPYTGQTVTVTGVVTGEHFYSGSSSSNFGFYIADATGGPWSGLFVYSSFYQPVTGDLVQLTGTVTEYYNFTELTPITSFQVISQGNPLPQPALISTATLGGASGEQWESVLVKTQNVTVATSPNAYQEFYITDGSGTCQVDDQFFASGHTWSNVQLGLTFISLTGIVDYGYSIFAINPRSNEDMQAGGSTLSLSLPQITTALHSNVSIPVTANGLYTPLGYQNYQIRISYDPATVQYQSFDTAGTLSQNGNLTVSAGTGYLDFVYHSSANLGGNNLLFKLNFYAANTGVSPLNLSNVQFEQDTVSNLLNGSVTVNGNYNSPGDKLTVIQQPILNIPAIQIPQESMPITCLAPQNTTGFNAWLLHGNKRISLPITSATWATNPNRWVLQTIIPQVAVFELYDLEVNADGGIHDISRNAVSIVPSRKTNYYFVHITDLHMPNRLFYPNPGWDTDSTEVVDFRAVMDDINIIRPEFVLLTGDLVNEGEIENFNNQYWFGWAQKVISELQVPVYLTTGNHDIGGWNSTPPPQGSSRYNWWDYFGWSWLDNTDVNWPYHTQDYFFTYNNTLYIGLEAYNNYDNFRPGIYGTDSFTDQQIAWLNNTIGLFPGYNKLVFHHYDFQDDLNLSAMGLNMSLKGHTHSNSGSITTQPYDLTTRSVCSGNRAYRVIRVNNDQFAPTATLSAGANGTNITANFYPSNVAIADSVTVVLNNSQSLAFDNSLVKFNMPPGNSSYVLSGEGVLEQIDRDTAKNVCYVRVNLPAYGNRTVTLKTEGVATADLLATPSALHISACWPNPLRSYANLEIISAKDSSSSTVLVYNLKGQKVQELPIAALHKGTNQIGFTLDTHLSSGIYFLRLKNQSNKPFKVMLIK